MGFTQLKAHLQGMGISQAAVDSASGKKQLLDLCAQFVNTGISPVSSALLPLLLPALSPAPPLLPYLLAPLAATSVVCTATTSIHLCLSHPLSQHRSCSRKAQFHLSLYSRAH